MSATPDNKKLSKRWSLPQRGGQGHWKRLEEVIITHFFEKSNTYGFIFYQFTKNNRNTNEHTFTTVFFRLIKQRRLNQYFV